ncbi:MAG: APC family permease [Actinobacteria bacterium]|nr:APC family permease [Actinomycetota bacterium]
MAAAFAAPSTSVFFASPLVAAFAGEAMVAVFIVSAIAIGFVATNIASFSGKLPSSGYAYTYVSHGLGPKAGFVSAWMTLLVFACTPIILPPVFGETLGGLVESLIGVYIPWWVYSLALLSFVGMIVILGIKDSLEVSGVLVLIEIAVVGGLAAYMIFDSPHAQAPHAFSPGSASSLGGFAVAAIFGILCFQGFESAATLGEETRHSKVSVPRALMSAVLVLGVFYAFTAYGATVGWGGSNLGSYSESFGPWIELAKNYGGEWLADIFRAVVCAGMLAGTIAGTNAAARMLFAMGRDRVLPGGLAKVSPRHGAPVVASLLIVVAGGGAGVIAAAAWSPTNLWGFVGSIISLGAILVYIMVSASVIPFFRREHRAEMKLIRHVLIPILAIVILTVPLWIKNGLLWPVPEAPYNLVPYIILGWLLVGVGIVLYLRARRPMDLEAAGSIVLDEPETTPVAAEPELV